MVSKFLVHDPRLNISDVNIIIFELNDGETAPAMVSRLKDNNILGYAISPNRIRLVVHLDITEKMVQQTIESINKL